jgi:predicted amidophosphoribosyltransferase
MPLRLPPPESGGLGEIVQRALLDAAAVLLPVSCAACGAPDRSVCDSCRAALRPVPHRVERDGLPAWAGLEYRGLVATAVGAFKDGDRSDAASVLAPALRSAIASALAGLPPGSGRVEVCMIPSTPRAMRRRGYAPVELLLGRCGIRSSPVLRLTRERQDQSGLGIEERRANAAGALEARRGLAGRSFLIVDDVLTTGATLAEAARAVTAAGGRAAAFAVLAETPRRHPPGAGSSRETLRDIASRAGYGGMTGVVEPPFRSG